VNYEDKENDMKMAIDLKVKTVMEVKERKKLLVMMQALKMAVML
jgi:hypothetical protein